MASTSQKPRGIFGHLFIQSIQYIGGANLHVDNGDFDLSGGNGMNAVEGFPQISKLIVSSVVHPIQNTIWSRNDVSSLIVLVAEALFNLGKALKSKKKANSVKFTDTIFHWHAEWDTCFPDVSYFPKLHDDFQYPPFVQKMSSTNVLWRRVLNQAVYATKQMFKTSFARLNSSLKEGMAEPIRAAKKWLAGKPRGSYNV